MKARFSLIACSLLAASCSCGSHDEAAPPPSSATAPPVTTTTPVPAGMGPEAFAAALAQARAAVEAHDYSTARSRFDALVADPGATPPIRCEAGWVTHLAGDDAAAATSIDAALIPFSSMTPTPALSRELAMCFDNRGRIYEDQHAMLDAREMYARSMMLRTNTAVQARLDAIPDDPSAHQTVGGIAYDFSSYVLSAASDAELEHALSVGWRSAAIVGHATVTRRAEVELPGPTTTRALVYALHSDDGRGDTNVLALAIQGGFRLADLGPSREPPTARMENGALRVDVTSTDTREWAYDGAFRPDTVCLASCTYVTQHTIVCPGEPSPCRDIAVSMHADDLAHTPIVCRAVPSGELVDGAPSATPTPIDGLDYEAAVDIAASGVTIRTVRGVPPATEFDLAQGTSIVALSGDHYWCADITPWRFDGDTSPAPAAWAPELMPQPLSSWVAGVTPPIAVVAFETAEGMDEDRAFYEHLGLETPFHGAWRRPVVWEAGDDGGGSLPTIGTAELADLIPGEPREIRIPVHYAEGCDGLVVCAMIGGALNCREAPPPDCHHTPASAAITFDGQGHVTVIADGEPTGPQDLAAWIGANVPDTD